MKHLLPVLLCLVFTNGLPAQNFDRPKLVVGIVADQMRWDYLYRYYNRYLPQGGFKRLLAGGFSCENTNIPYAQTVTACGHSSIYTGSVPAINGITGNSWFDYETNSAVNCVEDEQANTIGSASDNGKMSPHHLMVTTVCDELSLATNFRSKIVSIALKDRGSILPAGHHATNVYWFDPSNGYWITSSYYMKALPDWVTNFNKSNLPDKYLAEGWKTLYPAETYVQSSADKSGSAKDALGKGNKFPYQLSQFSGKNYTALEATPFGNTLTLQLCKAALQNEKLGEDSVTDILAVSLSSPDYIGHTFGPNSVEQEDNFLRLDKDLGDFLDFLDETVGKGAYLVFLSADHGAAHVPSFLDSNNIPAGTFNQEKTFSELNDLLEKKFRTAGLVSDINNNQVYLNRAAIASGKINETDIHAFVINYLEKQPFITRAIEAKNLGSSALNSVLKERYINGYYRNRSGDVVFITKPQWIDGFENGGTTHGTWYPYDAHIPLLFYGWKIKPGHTAKPTSITDIAPTLSSLLHIQMPSGCVGNPITEITQ